MYLLKNKKAFTLIELIIAISLISFVALWATRLNFNNINDKQQIENYTNKIKNNIENIRNKALAWKWIWADLNIPKKWILEFSKNWSWTIITKALDENWNTLINDTFNVKTWYSFSSIKCWKYWESENNYSELEYTWAIDFIWWDIKLIIDPAEIDCWVNDSKILLINVVWLNNSKRIKIDTLSWLVEIK